MPTPASTNVALTGLAQDLARRADEAAPIRIGLIGAGEMGADIVSRVAHMTGIEVAAIASRRPEAAFEAIRIAFGDADRAKEAASGAAVERVIEQGGVAVGDAAAVVESGLIDVIIDATGAPDVGARIGMDAMARGKHLVMMNVEADVCIGAYLKAEAKRQGVVYTLAAGDEPSACMELIEFVSAMGHPVIAAGKGKNNPLNFEATPDQYEEEARARNMNPRMLVEFVDGSKTMVEMAAIANATGLIPDKPGMHGPSATRDELAKVLIPTEDGGVLSAPGRVDFTIGAGVAPGVFVVVKMDHPRIHERMRDLKMGEGPYFTLMRPYHLTSLEAPLSAARAVLYGKADMVPLDRPVAEVCAVAKRDLAPGEVLDRIGETCYRAWIMTAGEARAAEAIPCGLLVGARTTRPVGKGDLITRANAAVPADSEIAALRARQDAMFR